jgi:hypothetical protein
MAATVMTAAHYSVFFKNRYPQRKIEDTTAYGKPWLSQTSKSDELVGVTTYVPLQTDSPQGMSAKLPQAMTNVTSTRGIAWAITPVSFYAGLSIDAKTMLASRNNEGAFFRSKEREVDGILEQMGQNFEMSLWRDGSGSVGQLLADPGTGTTFTLLNVADALNIHIGMVIRFYSNTSGQPDTERAGGTRVVASVNEDTGVVTVTAPNALDAALAANDHVVRDAAGGAGNLNLAVAGIPSWITAADPTATLFKGVDRSVAPQKLAGHRQSWLGTIEETAKRLDAKIRRVNQKAKQLWLSYDNFNRLDLELGARGYRMEDGGTGTFGRVRLFMATPGGGVEVKTGPYVPDNAGFLLTPDTWKIMHLGGLPHMVQDDGLVAVRVGFGSASEDSIEIRFRAFWEQVCLNPYANGRFPIV